MTMRQATAGDVDAIRRLLAHGRRVYNSLAAEDLPALVARRRSVVGDDRGRLWGFAGVELEARPSTLPAPAPDRAYLRAVALAAGYSPAADGVHLLAAAGELLTGAAQSILLIAFVADHWLADILPTAGFALTEQVQTFELNLRSAPVITPDTAPSAIILRPMQPDDLEAVARLDALAFPPLWHYGNRALWELLFSGRTQVAVMDKEIVGYTGVAQRGDQLHLTRIAVHPAWQGAGIGTLLLTDVIDYARQQRIRSLTLNTQVSNARAQALYQQHGFQATKQIALLFTRLLEG
jgi:ribosomal-protein-alanine N-acetyltransferase